MKVFKWLDDRFEETFLVVLLAVICVVELSQVIIRKIPFIPALTWAEEFCRFMWIWSVFISLPYTIRKSSMLRVTAALDILPQTGKKAVNIFVDFVTFAVMAFCTFHSVTVVKGIVKSGETSPAMLWPMWIVYSFMLIGFALASARAVQMIIIHISDFAQESGSAVEKTVEETSVKNKAGKQAEGGRK